MITAPVIDPHANPFTGWDLRTFLELQAQRQGKRPCMIWEPFEGEPMDWSYRGFVEAVARTGAGLAAEESRLATA